MTDERPVLISAEQAQILEDVGVLLMRMQDDRAMKVLALSLAYKFAKPEKPSVPLPDNVVFFDHYSKRVVVT